MNIKPLFDNVLIEPIEKETQTEAGIFIAGESEDGPDVSAEGVILAVGKGTKEKGKFIPLQVKVGDRVLFSKYELTEVKVNKKTYLIAKERDILAIKENE